MINFAKYSLLIYLLLKPFYLFSSGGLQIADAFLLLAFALLVAGSWHIPAKRRLLAETIQSNRLFVIFVACTIIINSLYFFVYPEFKFLLSSLYFVFNLAAIVLFAIFFKDKVFLARVGSIFKLNLLLQLALWALHFGRFYSDDRYMGTFNDPNQFGYYVLLALLFIYAIDMFCGNKRTYIYYFIAAFLILQSGSTGMLFGVSMFSVLFIIDFVRRQLVAPTRLIRGTLYAVTGLIGISVLMYFVAQTMPQSSGGINVLNEPFVFSRVDEKAEKISGDSNMTLIQDRNIDVVTEYPVFILFGSGEGAFWRFTETAHAGGEIHSTFLSILFYYGLVPFLVIVVWMHKHLRGSNWSVAIIYVTLFAVSFILLNQRQSLFWALIVLCGMLGQRLLIHPEIAEHKRVRG